MSSCEFHELNLGQTCFFLMSFIPTLLLVPCWIVAKFIHEPAIKKAQKESLPPVPIPFTGRYPLSEAAHKTDNLDKLDKCVVLAGTPDGLVCMRYCAAEEGFEYWANKSIKYNYLEVVARKYVTIFSCRDLYLNRSALLLEKLKRIKSEIEERKKATAEGEEQEEEPDEGDVFASLKSYNTSKGADKQDKICRKDIVCDEANKYINRGRIEEAELSNSKIVKDTTNLQSYDHWKQMLRDPVKEDIKLV